MIVAIPAITPALVPGPVIKKANIAPPLAPASINEFMTGKADAPLTYKGRPIIAVSGTARMLFELNNVVIKEAGTN